MKTPEFDKVVNERIEAIKATLTSKAKEYATNTDRLHNFNRAGKISGQCREKALWGFALKHYVSFLDILDRVDAGLLPSEEHLNEKVGDLINYLILVEACIKDRINTDNNYPH